MSAPLSVRIVSVDALKCKPRPATDATCSHLFPGVPLRWVPVVRLFGLTVPDGRKCCLHVHQVYPYVLVPYYGPTEDQAAAQAYIGQLGASMHRALCLARQVSLDPAKSQYIMGLLLVRGVPFYGFHESHAYFVKVYLLDAHIGGTLAELLLAGAIMGRPMQPYESHIPYGLQFFIDYNLYGMATCQLRGFKSRGPVYARQKFKGNQWQEITGNSDHIVDTTATMFNEHAWLPDEHAPGRVTSCEVELDTWPWLIANRDAVAERRAEPFEPVSGRDEKLVHSLEELWEDDRRRRADSSQQSAAQLSPTRRLDRTPTEVEAAVTAAIGNMHARIKGGQRGDGVSYLAGQPVKPDDGYKVMTVFQSVSALYPAEFAEFANSQNSNDNSLILPSPLEASQLCLADLDRAVVDVDLVVASQQQRHQPWLYDQDDARVAVPGNEQPEIIAAADDDDEEDLDVVEVMEWMAAGEDLTSDDPLFEIPQTDGASDDPPNSNSNHNNLARHLRKKLKQEAALEEPNREEGEFVHAIGSMWSPRKSCDSQAPARPSFYYSPPRPVSPEIAGDCNIDMTEISSSRSSIDFGSDCNQTQMESSTWRSFERPPNADEIEETFAEFNLPVVDRPDPFYTRPQDVQNDFSGAHHRRVPPLRSDELLSEFRSTIPVQVDHPTHQLAGPILKAKRKLKYYYWTPAELPPSAESLEGSIPLDKKTLITRRPSAAPTHDISQIIGPTPKNAHGFKFTQNTASQPGDSKATQGITCCSLELHCNSRGQLRPDPELDAIQALFCCFWEDNDDNIVEGDVDNGALQLSSGIFALRGDNSGWKNLNSYNILLFDDEREMLEAFASMVKLADPDIVLGYEIHKASWGYLIERYYRAYGQDMSMLLSRIVSTPAMRRQEGDKEVNQWGLQTTSSVEIGGRTVLNAWRLMRSELAMTSYTFENIAHHVLHKRVPHFSHQTLTGWYGNDDGFQRWRTLQYYRQRAELIMHIMDRTNFISKTSEFARIYGVDFFSVINRGSQFKVESMMFRIAKPENFVMVSPNRRQVFKMRAMECLPLVMEPESGFYKDPVIVLDFQSLYPSIMIAYNYCYSTCLGKFTPHQLDTLGFAPFRVRGDLIQPNSEHINVSPNGVAFFKPNVRKSVLAKMLSEILDTRVMVKNAMKRSSTHKSLHRALDSKQLGLKLVANVTYGYTSAGFSGRMPCSEIADSIVQTGRVTLERAIRTINNTAKWNGRVVYGDTDSLFVVLPGATKERAFQVSAEIAAAISAANPAPMKLKFEKVYHPCVLLSKKRYVGFKYESLGQTEPEFDAKGIETVRRDTCVAVGKMLQVCLQMLFRTQDLSQVKQYVQDHWRKMFEGRVSIQDFIFAKAVRLGTYSNKVAPPPGAFISLNKMKGDARAEPEYGERVPYVIAYNGPNARLVDCARSPQDFLQSRSHRLHCEYYITRQIVPVLARVFSLVGVDVMQWYQQLPKTDRTIRYTAQESREQPVGTTTIDRFFAAKVCLVCGGRSATKDDVCNQCRATPHLSVLQSGIRVRQKELKYATIVQVCNKCCAGRAGESVARLCDSIDCPVFYERLRARTDAEMAAEWHDKISGLF